MTVRESLAEPLIRGYLGPDADPDLSELLTDQLAFWFWLDDEVDGGRPPPPLRWDGVDGGAWAPLHAVDAALWSRRPSPEHRQRWRASATDVVRAMEAEASLDPATDLLEYAAIGATTSTVPHLFVTLGWFVGRPLDDPPTATLIRRLALEARLENDLVSVGRDRGEGTAANAVILLAATVGDEAALTWVRAAQARLAAAVERAAAAPGVDPAALALARRMRATHAMFYDSASHRYGP